AAPAVVTSTAEEIVLTRKAPGANDQSEVLHWSAATQTIETLASKAHPLAYAVSEDGRVIAGSDDEGPVIWRDGSLVRLPFDTNPNCRSLLSEDGGKLAGCSNSRAAFWTLDSEVEELGPLPAGARFSAPLSASPDLSVVVGTTYDTDSD